MAITALQLITRAYYLSQVVARDLQTVSGSQIEDGLYLLNALLEIKGSDIRLIPYYTYYEFESVQGQEKYFIPNLYYIESMTFDLQTVRYPMNELTRYEYFATGRVNNIQSLPFSWHYERVLGGSDIYLYFLPEQAYTMKLMGKFALTDVTLATDLTTVYDKFYIEYLRYALAEYICSDWGVNFPELAAKKFAEIRKKLMDVESYDLTIRKLSSLNKQDALNWAIINISNGYVPG